MNIQEALVLAAQNAWSGFSVNNTTFGSADCATMTEEINKSLLYNTKRDDFPFQKRETSFVTVASQRAYVLDDVYKVENVYLTDGSDYLELIDESPFLDTTEGEPTQYYLKYIDNELNMCLHTIPNDVYTVNIVHEAYKFVLAADDTEKEKFTAEDDTLNIPEPLQELFWRCIFNRAMQTNNKNDTDENYQPIISEYKELWTLFLDKAIPVKKAKRIILL
jgi:hypothetical protein